MNFSIRDGKLDVLVAAGPRLDHWPSIGVRTLSVLCAENGLTVGQYGGDSVKVRGVVQLPKTGGIVIIEDGQSRIHRITARSIVRIIPPDWTPDPFPGWQSSGLIPLSSAERLFHESQIHWEPAIAILGTGNRALRFGSKLLEKGVSEVYCIESHSQGNLKRYSGWEVERRRFEMAGGKILEATPIQLSQKSPQLWQLRLQDTQGIRVLEVARVVSAGRARPETGIKEYPPGAGLYELNQTALQDFSDDAEGWSFEAQRARWLANKIIRALTRDIEQKEELDQTFRKAKARLKYHSRHLTEPFQPTYEGKWLSSADTKKLKEFGGTPKQAHQSRQVASIECFEDITCRICEKACPTGAIQVSAIARSKNLIFDENKCTGCTICVQVCPSGSIPMLQENSDRSFSTLTLPWRGAKPWSAGEFATLLNRRGESLGSARIQAVIPSQNQKTQLVQLEVPTHLIWDARGIRRNRTQKAEDPAYLASLSQPDLPSNKVEVSVNGEKRLVRDKISVSMALFEMGQSRAEDKLLCSDGSCGLCQISINGNKRLACQTKTHLGISMKTLDPCIPRASEACYLCPCLEISKENVIEHIKQGKLQSPEAVLSLTKIGEGKCHGQLCMEPLKRILTELGLPASSWVDWRFPWSDWALPHS